MKFNYSKNKILFFDIVIEGLDQEKLTYIFSIKINDVNFGFEGGYKNGKVKFEIEPFKNFLRDKIIEEGKSYEAKMIVHDDKIFSLPFNGSIKFEVSPEITAKLTSENTKTKSITKPSVKVTEIKVKEEPSKDDIVSYLAEKVKSFSKPSPVKPKKEKVIQEKKVVKTKKKKAVVKETAKKTKKYEEKDIYTSEDVSKLMTENGMTDVKFQNKFLESLEFSKGLTEPNEQFNALLKVFNLVEDDAMAQVSDKSTMNFLQELRRKKGL